MPTSLSAEQSLNVSLANTGTANSWTADADYILTGVSWTASGSADAVLTTDATPAGGTGFFQAASKSYRGNILSAVKALATNWNSPAMRNFIGKGTKVTMAQTSVNTVTALLTLVKT